MEINRYNKLGEWKPIIFSGDSEDIQQEVKKLSDNPIIRGILFYAKTTGYNCIEFVMKTNIDLPINGIFSIDNILHVYKCPPFSKAQESVIYDCWFELSSLDTNVIESELLRIRLAVNRLGIAFRTPIDWCIKYNYNRSLSGKGMATEEDLSYFNNILVASVNDNDLHLIEYAIDWFNQALVAKNPFTKYLCYFTSIETLVTKIADGETEFHAGIDKLSKNEKIDCIEKLEKEIRVKSDLQFIQDSYDNCIKSINRKFKIVLPAIIGEEHWSIKLFFDGEESLFKIRNKITHGEYSLFNKDHEKIVNENLSDIAEIAREFILRLLLKKSKKDILEDWGNLFSSSFPRSDPRNTMVCTTEMIFPTNDWRIKPEWC